MTSAQPVARTRLRMYVGLALTPVAVAVIALFAVPLVQSFREAEASSAMATKPAPIDGERAFGYLKKICAIGPRMAGTEPNTRQRKMVAEHFQKMGAKVLEQPFQSAHPLTGQPVNMVNLVGMWNPDRLDRIVIAAHYDTRPEPDQEMDPIRHKQPFIGANDGGSGVALLMELAHHMNDLKTQWGVDLVLLDGEELVYGNEPRRGEYFLGSKEFARRYVEQVESNRIRYRYAGGIVLDMVGGKDLAILQEPNSLRLAPKLVREIWTTARQIGVKSFRFSQGREVLYDHLPLNDAGIPTIDVIDFEYPYWHKADDLPEHCSARSLTDVGRVLTAWLLIPRKAAQSRR
jgi:glutaminyl-peptide cyclotransferase